MDAIAAAGVVGRANHVPAHLPPGSDVANLSLLGYSPLEHFTGRAPLEAAAQGIELGERDWAIRCNLVTIEDQMMRDFTAGHISSEEAAALLGEKGKLYPKRMVTVVVPDDQVKCVVETIINTNQTGMPGDGKIFVVPLADAIRVRTGEYGAKAIA